MISNISRAAIAFAYIIWHTAGSCEFCVRGLEQFCRSGQMIGKHRDGGYAEFIKVPGAMHFPFPMRFHSRSARS